MDNPNPNPMNTTPSPNPSLATSYYAATYAHGWITVALDAATEEDARAEAAILDIRTHIDDVTNDLDVPVDVPDDTDILEAWTDCLVLPDYSDEPCPVYVLATDPSPQAIPDGHHRQPRGGGLVADTATVEDTVWVDLGATIGGSATVTGCVRVEDHATVTGHARVEGDVTIGGHGRVEDHATVTGCVRVEDHATIGGHATVTGYVHVGDHVTIGGHATVGVGPDLILSGSARVLGHATVTGSGTKVYGAILADDNEICGR